MAAKFPAYTETRVWQTPEGLSVEYRCEIEGENALTTVDVRALPPDVTDAVLGAEVLGALQQLQVRTWEDIDPALAKIEEAFPDYEKFVQRYHSVFVSFDSDREAHIKLDGRAAGLNKPNRTEIPSDSSKAAVGSAIRHMLAKLEGQVPIKKSTSPKKKPSSRAKKR